MSFKDQVAADIKDVFLNFDEFATDHDINGKIIRCVVDENQLINLSDMASIGTHLGEKRIFVDANDLDGKPLPGKRMDMDGKIYFVRNLIDNMGMYEIRLGANAT